MSTPNDTLRARLEAIRERHGARFANQDDFLTYSDAEAALRILDEADRLTKWHQMPGYTATDGSLRLVPDPGGRAAPPPTTTTTP